MDGNAKRIDNLLQATASPNYVDNDSPGLSELTADRSPVSREAHSEILTYFSSLVPEGPPGGPDTDWFFFHYKEICGFTNKTTGRFQATLPPPFNRLLEDHLLFYIRVLSPYFRSIGPSYAAFTAINDPRDLFIRLSYDLGGEESEMLKRWSAGLLRKEQTEILEMVLRKMYVELKTLLVDIQADTKEVRSRELVRILWRTREVVRCLVQRLRSERLEVLLCRYLGEEEINWKVVRGVDDAQRKWENRMEESRKHMLTQYMDWLAAGKSWGES
ncbi:hypothetical protein BJ508DRAFT_366413 [Ascobolus immersus RN42]|uniref:Uncharacterized protein n=1 Tax=Ascobolus immersus RN42 TaxID=1160509 RepID=A0A3N4HJP4_ASCIM|nr:hypothetical protein BJ508DRAFT_366413 [Ascobolus immersus RN42]